MKSVPPRGSGWIVTQPAENIERSTRYRAVVLTSDPQQACHVRRTIDMIIGIVAVDRNGAIGKGGQLPWHYSSDMKHFKATTMGHACVMGHKTWLTLKRPLKGRLNIVLSRQSQIEPQESVVVLRDLGSVLSLNSYLKCDLFVIGGQKVYESFLPDIDRWIVTEVPLEVEDADAFVPQNYLNGFIKTDSKRLEENLVVNYFAKI